MVALPPLDLYEDPTLNAIDKAIENRQSRDSRPYLGMSSIGGECGRSLWYNFRWAEKPDFKASTLKLFYDGHLGEDIMINRFKLLDDVTLETIDPETGYQIGFDFFGGHFKGHADGIIHGIYQAPATTHVWEHKVTNQKKFDKLKALKKEAGEMTGRSVAVGEKNALREWDPVYYAQGVLYMHFSGLSRHYMTVGTAGSRLETSCRTNANPKFAQELLNKAENIIFSDEPPAKISDKPSFYVCKWCNFSDTCHKKKLPEVNCRTCLHSEVQRQGGWRCNKHKQIISIQQQRDGCDKHLFHPTYMAGTPTDAGDEFVSYSDGSINQAGGAVIYREEVVEEAPVVVNRQPWS